MALVTNTINHTLEKHEVTINLKISNRFLPSSCYINRQEDIYNENFVNE